MAASTSYNQIPSFSTSPPTATLWDIFLSFRGLDTRFTFTDHLYKALLRTGIRTFMDDHELRSGEVISDSLIQAMQDSKAYIVVLSENYASSPWCLDELVEILQCCRTMQRLVIPVFYNIDPSVVRHQNGIFKQAFQKHQGRFDMEKVEKWSLALKEVSHFSGYRLAENRSEADIVDEVIERVLLEINPVTLNVAKYPVGLDSRVEGVTALFNSDVEAVIKIGIYGMGGVGKTTLAKAVYNQNYQRFQGSCFLANVREVSGLRNGLVSLQKQLLADVLKSNNINVGNVDQGIELIRARICSRKVLIVIDDLDDPKPLEYLQGSFALGSMVIITTRNEDLLDRIEVKAKYKVNQMDKDESLQLFTQHAFGEDKKLRIFTELSKEVLKHAGGLPLALQVFGSTLLNESEDTWKSFIEKLKLAPIGVVEENLMISFDALKSVDRNLQDIFLDIACFYVGWKKEKVVEILETCYSTFVNLKIDILKKRSLITINERHELGMHDLLRDMGREIARNNSPDEPWKHSRLWVSEDVNTVLKNHKGTEAIESIISGYFGRVYKKEDEGVTFDAESFKRMSKLRFLYLNNVNLTGSFEQTFEDLRWLRCVHCPLECLPCKFYPQKLVTLELPYSNMRTMGEQNMVLEKLKTLDMSHSRNLITAPDFTLLPCLETLNLKGCRNLRSLPDTICSLRALEVLIVDGCSGLKALPTKLGTIESLKKLRAGSLSVPKLPDSIGRLSSLVSLNLRGNKYLEALPDSIGNLRSLEILDICYCEKLEELPDQLGMITCLRELHLMKDTKLRILPDISQLSNIKDLYLRGCSNLLSISQLPPNLEEIGALDCKSLRRLPDLSSLKHLKNLDLTDCNALKEIQGLEEVTSLEDLRLVDCRSLERLPNLCNLKHLWRLDLTNCSGLAEIQGLTEITDLNLSGCHNLLSISELPPNLETISAKDCCSLKRLPDLSSLKHLRYLDLTNCVALKEIQGLEEVTSLGYLCLANCRSLERLPILSSLKHLWSLDLTNCSCLTEIQGLEELTSLKLLKDGRMQFISSCNLKKHLSRK